MDVMQALIEFVENKKSHSEAAKALKISDAYLSRLLSGERPITERIAQKFGYTKRVSYVKAEQ